MSRPARAEYASEVEAHRRAWERKPGLRSVYGDIFARLQRHMADGHPVVEIGTGVGSSRRFLPSALSADIVDTPWVDLRMDAHDLPIGDDQIRNLVLVDVLHHLHRPLQFFREAERVLAPGGRLLLCEPYLSFASYAFYRWIHREGADRSWDLEAERSDKAFANQAAESILFGRADARRASAAPRLRIVVREPFALFAYPLSGGFQRWSLLPSSWIPALQRVESVAPAMVRRALGWRVLTVLEKIA